MIGDMIGTLVRSLPVARRIDGWVNILTGLGSVVSDKVTATKPFWWNSLTYQQLSDLFHGDAIVRKIVTKRPADSLAQGIRLSVPDDAGGYDVATKIQDALDDLKAVGAFYEALTWENLFGGSVIFMALDDGNNAIDSQEQPVRWDALERVLWLKVFDCFRVRPSPNAEDQEQDPESPHYGEPNVYTIDLLDSATLVTGGRQVRVHRDRLIIFPGPLTTDIERRNRLGWGVSIIDPAYASLQRNATAWQAAGNAFANAQYVIYKLRGLAHMFSMQDGEERAKARARAMELAKSMINAVLIDAEDDYIRENPAFGNMSEMLSEFGLDLSAAVDIPATVLWGRSPAGMNATGESDLQLWYKSCGSYQEHHIRPRAQQLVEALMYAKQGPTAGQMLEGWRVTFPPMRVLSDLEKADIRSKTSHADEIDIKTGVLLPQEVALNRFKPEGYSQDTQIDRDLRMKLQKLEIDAREEELKEGRGPGQTPPEPVEPPPGEGGGGEQEAAE